MHLVVGRDECTRRIEQQCSIESLLRSRVSYDRTAVDSDAGLAGSRGHPAVPLATGFLGVFLAPFARRRDPGMERQLGEQRQLGAGLARLGQPSRQPLGTIRAVKNLVYDRQLQHAFRHPRLLSPMVYFTAVSSPI